MSSNRFVLICLSSFLLLTNSSEAVVIARYATGGTSLANQAGSVSGYSLSNISRVGLGSAGSTFATDGSAVNDSGTPVAGSTPAGITDIGNGTTTSAGSNWITAYASPVAGTPPEEIVETPVSTDDYFGFTVTRNPALATVDVNRFSFDAVGLDNTGFDGYRLNMTLFVSVDGGAFTSLQNQELTVPNLTGNTEFSDVNRYIYDFSSLGNFSTAEFRLAFGDNANGAKGAFFQNLVLEEFTPTTPPAPVIPEPSVFALLSGALLYLGFSRRRKTN